MDRESSVPERNFEKNRAISQAGYQAPNQRALASEDRNLSWQQSSSLPWWHSQFNLMLFAFALLAIAVLLFIQLLPAADPQQGDQETLGQATSNAAATSNQELSPWSASQQAEARKTSQDILAQLIEVKNQLNEKRVEDWAESKFASALELATQGDELYAKQEYPEAIQTYESALKGLQDLNDSAEDYLENFNQQGLEALHQGKSSLSEKMYTTALAIDAQNETASRGVERAKQLDTVLRLVEQAQIAQADFDETTNIEHLLSSEKLLTQAAELDAELPLVKESLVTIEQKLRDQQFKQAMSKGFANLFSGKNSNARTHFSAAMQLRPQDKMARSAFRQARGSGHQASIAATFGTAQAHEQKEDWSQALNSYTQLLSKDPNSVEAKLGQIRSRARSQLANKIESSLADPVLLSAGSAKLAAQEVLKDAKAIKSPGPVLRSQIDKLESSLNSALQSVKVRLISDSQTEVSLTKLGSSKLELGTFNSKNLSLKSGRYVLRGKRAGYQNVRLELEINPAVQQGVVSVEVKCDNRISRHPKPQTDERLT